MMGLILPFTGILIDHRYDLYGFALWSFRTFFFWQVTRVTLDSSSWQTWKQHLFSDQCVAASIALWFPIQQPDGFHPGHVSTKNNRLGGTHFHHSTIFRWMYLHIRMMCTTPFWARPSSVFFLVVGGQRNSLGVLYRFHCAGCWPLSFRLGTTQLGAAGSTRLWCCHWRKFRRNGGFLFGVSQKKAKEPRKTCEWRGDLGHHQKMAWDLSEDELSKVTSPTLRHQLCVLGSRGRIVPRLCYPKMIDMRHPSCTSFQRDFGWWISW